MNYVVLVKQVPDISNIPEEAWDWEKGTLKRGLLDNICNEKLFNKNYLFNHKLPMQQIDLILLPVTDICNKDHFD